MRRRPPGWNPPGPIPPGERADPSLRPAGGETLDCLAGHWKIFQLRKGHRYSTDDLLTAWFAVNTLRDEGRTPGTHLDLGCGVGSIGLLLLWKYPGLRSVGLEAQAASTQLARRSLRYNGVEKRAEVRLGDFRSSRALAPGERFDLVTGSPPYLACCEGIRSAHSQRGACRFEDRGGCEDYLRAGFAHLAPGGVMIWVHASRYVSENVRAARAVGFGSVRWRKVVFREGKKSLISLFQARQPTTSETQRAPDLVVRQNDGAWSREYRVIRREMGFPV